MQPATNRTANYHNRRYRRIWRWAILASLLFHLIVLLLFREARPIPPSPFAAAGPRAGDERAAAGGGMQVVALEVVPVQPQPVPKQVIPVPIPVPEPKPEVKPEEPPKPVVTAVVTTIEGTGKVGEAKGTETGAGIEGGTGKGDGGTSEEGLFRVVPPSPRGLILPPSDRPGKVRGKEVDVWVFVTVRGEVVSDSTRLDPGTTGDRKFDERLKKQAAEWVFDPAKRGGKAVAEWFRYTIIL
jgi:hypothetical protein